jgi:periplasmic divalent cation tolerance protein
MPDEVLMVFTTMPDAAQAQDLARVLIESHTAACVNVMSGCHSLYRWQGAVESAGEIPLLIKTTRSRYPDLERELRAHHPYELPEIVAIPVVAGSLAYLDWVRSSVAPPR